MVIASCAICARNGLRACPLKIAALCKVRHPEGSFLPTPEGARVTTEGHGFPTTRRQGQVQYGPTAAALCPGKPPGRWDGDAGNRDES